ncbi:transporter family-2 protein [Pseudonocardia eucalypti]|uniref:DMT family transporter n=1 Tax=Pseudonocardia eucalypti TaxID=648755 RepID=UPI0017F5EEE0|nr:transporter family-2 protein [Pseudonocardia eucalypti]
MSPSPRAQVALGLFVAVLAGAGIAGQTRLNGALAARLHDGLAAALISFGTGLLLVAVLVAVAPAARAGVGEVCRALRDRRLRFWQLGGGLAGAFLVASQGLASPALGIAVFSVAMVAGQVSSALLMDRLGIGPAGRRPVSARRLAGAGLAVLAVLLSVSDRFGRPSGLVLTLLPLVAGVAVAWQQGVNGRVGAVARQARPDALGAAMWPATSVNFVVGTAGLLLVWGLGPVVGLGEHPVGPPPPELWLYLGGPVGVVFIAAGVLVVRVIGILLLGLGMVAGQLLCSLLFDALAPTAPHPLTAVTVAGCALTLVAAVVAAWPARSGRMAP